MGIFDRIRKSLSGGSGKGSSGDQGIYFYVRLDKSGEIVRLRLEPRHDLAPDYENGTYFSHKTIIGPKSIERAEGTFYFDEKRSFQRADIRGGELSEEEEYKNHQ